MLRSRAKFSEPEASNHAPSLVAFTTITPGLKFSVHTGIAHNGGLLADYQSAARLAALAVKFGSLLSPSRLASPGMNSLITAFPGRKLHVILDNLNTHKKNEDWLKAHPNVQFHFTPTSASWLNQVEVWFSILQGQSLSGTSFTSLKQLQEHIDAYVNAYNDKAQPFVWTKKKVRQRRFKGRRITQL
jgi:hypothetical protein